MPFGPKIPTERQWLTNCMILGFKIRDIPALRKLYRRVHPVRRRAAGLYVVRYEGHTLPKQFSAPEAAEKWALENYKGSREGWEIVPLAQVKEKADGRYDANQ